MKYHKANYKYTLVEAYEHKLHSNHFHDVDNDFFSVKNGILTAQNKYAWDGASGPTIDTKNSMKAGLVHDCLYQGIRLGNYKKEDRKAADQELYDTLRDEGMCWLRAKIWYIALRLFGAGAAKEGHWGKREKVIEV